MAAVSPPEWSAPQPTTLSRRFERVDAILTTMIPAASELDTGERHAVLARAEGTLAAQPARLVRQLGMLVDVIHFAAILRHGRTFGRLVPERRLAFLETLQDAPITRLRVGLWGLRTLLYMGYYGDPQRQAGLGYRPSRDGWAASVSPERLSAESRRLGGLGLTRA